MQHRSLYRTKFLPNRGRLAYDRPTDTRLDGDLNIALTQHTNEVALRTHLQFRAKAAFTPATQLRQTRHEKQIPGTCIVTLRPPLEQNVAFATNAVQVPAKHHNTSSRGGFHTYYIGPRSLLAPFPGRGVIILTRSGRGGVFILTISGRGAS